MRKHTHRQLVVCFLVFSLAVVATGTSAQVPRHSSAQRESRFAPDKMETVLYGVAYYPEYMPYDRLDKDVEMMQKAGINVDLLTSTSLRQGQTLKLKPWDLAIVAEQ
jgi:hypothetical protein